MSWNRVTNLNDNVVENQSGNVAVLSGVSQSVVAVSQPTANYRPTVAPNWNTGWWITNKLAGQFTVNFSVAAPPDNSGAFDWRLNT